MDLTSPRLWLRLQDTHRLISSRYPPVGLFDTVTSSEDLAAVVELEGWTNDRLSVELGLLHLIPPEEWVVGRPHATAVMAAFCHPRPGGGRFNDEDRGAWYAAFALETAHAEVIYHRTRELTEIGVFEARVEVRQYLADFYAQFHDIRGEDPAFARLHDPDSYSASQAFARALRAEGADGIAYRSVRKPGGECIACFRPPLVQNVRPAAHFEYRWSGTSQPAIRLLRADA